MSTFSFSAPGSPTPPDADPEVSINVVGEDVPGDNRSQHELNAALSLDFLSPHIWNQDRSRRPNPGHRSAPPTPLVGSNIPRLYCGNFSRSEENLTHISYYNSPSPSAESDEYSVLPEPLQEPPSPVSDASSIPRFSINISDDYSDPVPSPRDSSSQEFRHGLHLPEHLSPAQSLQISPSNVRRTPSPQLYIHLDPRNQERIQSFCPSPNPAFNIPLPHDGNLGSNGAPLFLTEQNSIPIIDDDFFFFDPPGAASNGTPGAYGQLDPPSSLFIPSYPATPQDTYFTHSSSSSLGKDTILQPRGQPSFTHHDHSYDKHNLVHQPNSNQPHMDHQTLVIQSQQVMVDQLPQMLPSQRPSDTFDPGPAHDPRPKTLNPAYIPSSAEDGISEEMNELLVEILAGAQDIDEASEKVHVFGMERCSPLPQHLFEQAAKRKVGTTEVQHAARKRKTKTASFRCVFCSYTLTAKDNLKNHYRSHLGFKPCRCTMSGCGMAFGNPSGLKRHMEKRHHVCQPSKRGGTRPKSVHLPET